MHRQPNSSPNDLLISFFNWYILSWFCTVVGTFVHSLTNILFHSSICCCFDRYKACMIDLSIHLWLWIHWDLNQFMNTPVKNWFHTCYWIYHLIDNYMDSPISMCWLILSNTIIKFPINPAWSSEADYLIKERMSFNITNSDVKYVVLIPWAWWWFIQSVLAIEKWDLRSETWDGCFITLTDSWLKFMRFDMNPAWSYRAHYLIDS